MTNFQREDISDRLLSIIRRRIGHYYDPAYLARKLACLPADIARAVDELSRIGYTIPWDKAGRVAFRAAPDLLLAAEIAHRLKTRLIGRRIHAFRRVHSTNTVAAQLAAGGAPDGTVVVAEEQTHGRGRHGREWFSAAGKGIYLSIIIYPDIDPKQAPGLSLMTATTLAKTLQTVGLEEVSVKWPNDCLVNGRKIGGILAELSAEIGHVQYIVMGVGINVNHRRRDFPAEVAGMATSVRAELKTSISRVNIVQAFLKLFERDYLRFQKKGLKSFRKKILASSSVLGRPIQLRFREEVISGRAVDIDDTGQLIVDIGGDCRAFNAGEITLIKN